MSDALPLVVEELTFRYRDRATPAIRGLDFSANRGEILLIAGASGCGKTTLVRAINGLVPRSYKGEVGGRGILGEDTAPWKLSTISQRVGTVLQDPERQILGTKVMSEVAFGLENLGLGRSDIRARVEEALALLRISDLRDPRHVQFIGRRKAESGAGRCPGDATQHPAAG